MRLNMYLPAIVIQAAMAIAVSSGQSPSVPSPETRARALVARMTTPEKVGQLMNDAPAIPRLQVPAYNYWNEGLHGSARSGYSTLFPQAIGMAAAWDPELMHVMGEVVSTEARAKYNEAVQHGLRSIYFGLTVWSPNINIFRDPRWGRGQETYGEDPLLTSRLAVPFLRGLQGDDPQNPRVIGTPKHFAVHSGPEADRHRFNVKVSQHDLWETYLPQFRAAVQAGGAQSVMCAYNEVDGVPACASRALLEDVLRKKWGFRGFVTSDCGAIDDFFSAEGHHYLPDKVTSAAVALRAGDDSNCGNTYAALTEALDHDLIREADLDRALERVFTARYRLGIMDAAPNAPYARLGIADIRTPEHLAASLRAARQSMVLLKNDGVLPLRGLAGKRIAVVGPNAASLAALEGNYYAIAKDPERPVDALQRLFPQTTFQYAQGAPYVAGFTVPVPRTILRTAAGSPEMGLKAEYFAVPTVKNATPLVTRTDHEVEFDWNASAPVDGLPRERFAARWTGEIVPPALGPVEFHIRLPHCFPCFEHDRFTLKIAGKVVAEYHSPGTEGQPNVDVSFHQSFVDDHPLPVELLYIHDSPVFGAGISFEWTPPVERLRAEAVRAAHDADLVVAFVGLSPALEGEEMKIDLPGFAGGDRTSLDLPESQLQLLKAVKEVGKPLVVVLMNGSALAVPWAEENADAIVEAWYPGERGGLAIAETLDGLNNPSGRLPVTFYRSVDQLPDFGDYSMQGRTYRYFKGTPLYEFGYGLSYTRFTYSRLTLSSASIHAGEALTVECDLENSGALDGEEVAQLYLVPPPEGNSHLSPLKRLAAFQRVRLRAGEKTHLRFRLSAEDLAEIDADGNRRVQAGRYSVAVAGGQPDTAQSSSHGVRRDFTIAGKFAVPR